MSITLPQEPCATEPKMSHGEEVQITLDIKTNKSVIKFGIGKKLTLSFSAITALTILAISWALISYQDLQKSIQFITTDSIPAISSSLKMEKEATSMVAIGASLIAAQTTEKRAEYLQELSVVDQDTQKLIQKLTKTDTEGALTGAIQENYAVFSANMQSLKNSIDQRNDNKAIIDKNIQQMLVVRQDLGVEFKKIVDGQRSKILQKMLGTDPEETDPDSLRRGLTRAVFAEIESVQAFNKIQIGADQVVNALSSASNASDVKSLKEAEGIFTDSAEIVGRTITLMKIASTEAGKSIVEHFESLTQLGQGENSIFRLKEKQIEAQKIEKDLLDGSRVNSDAMGDASKQLVEISQQQVTSSQASVSKTISKAKTGMITLAVASIIISMLIGVFYVRKQIVMRLKTISNVMSTIAQGDLSTRIPRGGNDEITEMALCVRAFREDAKDKQALELKQAELKKEQEQEKIYFMNDLAQDFEKSVGGLIEESNQSAKKMLETALGMSERAVENKTRANVVKEASDQATTNVQSVAAATEELSASINEISTETATSAGVAKKAVLEVEKVNKDILNLSEAASKIGQVVNLINDIAEQTNLLALNATIEAARAGDSGKGFTVVASEVKKLANQTAQATNDIQSQVTEIQRSTNAAVTGIQGIGTTMSNINQAVDTIAVSVEHQEGATKEIAHNIDLAATGTSEVSHTMNDVSRAAEKNSTATLSLEEASKQMQQQSAELSSRVQGFIKQIRLN